MKVNESIPYIPQRKEMAEALRWSHAVKNRRWVSCYGKKLRFQGKQTCDLSGSILTLGLRM